MKFHSFTVLPTTPEKLKPLLEIAYNLWFSWNWDAREIFKKLDPELWQKSNKNPLRMLCNMTQEKLEEAAEDKNFVAEVEAVYSAFKKYMKGSTWFKEQHGEREKPVVGYFSCEYGIHESLPIYSGGLGILAGDHLKSASDLGVPLVAVGLLYKQGYFRQGLNLDGQQVEFFIENDWFSMPVHLQKNEKDEPILLSMDMGGEKVFFNIWAVNVGRVKLYLLDTNIPENTPKHREITKRLYDSDRDLRIRQEILLGIGGVKALNALDESPAVFHINEGHSAFLIFERMKNIMQDRGLSFEEAKELVCATNVFTTHTPVPAGNERFDTNLFKHYLSGYAEIFGITVDELLSLGREEVETIKPVVKKNEDAENGEAEEQQTPEEDFCLTVLALKFSSFANGVSKLHGVVSRDMWQSLYPEIPKNEIPIGHITNGVHTKTWLCRDFESLFVRYLDTAYVPEISDFTLWQTLKQIPNEEIWRAHKKRKRKLIEFVRRHVKWQLLRRGSTSTEIAKADNLLDPNALTIGFARRFAPYKRGDLILKDVERLAKDLSKEGRPVQIILAGKAHPADENGKAIIKRVVKASEKSTFSSSIVFLEDYDIDMARHLVSGVDVWLNTPRRPLEASGTSGMKAAMNGVLNFSISDGWWEEAYNAKNGWVIGDVRSHSDTNVQDDLDANSMYRILEQDIIPCYYNVDEEGVPANWVNMMRETIMTCGAGFNAHRMVMDYIKDYYLRGEGLANVLIANNYEQSRELATWRKKVVSNWSEIEILKVDPPAKESVYSGSEVCINAHIKLGKIIPENLIVEVYHGLLDADDKIQVPERTKMSVLEANADVTVFSATINCEHGGHYGYAVRVLPGHKNLASEYVPELIKWSE